MYSSDYFNQRSDTMQTAQGNRFKSVCRLGLSAASAHNSTHPGGGTGGAAPNPPTADFDPSAADSDPSAADFNPPAADRAHCGF
jgi:hypothetical protein